MKKIISLLISFCLILAITPFNVLAAPNETTQSTDSNSNATQNVEPKVVVSDYGVQIDPNEIKGYSESNGNVENSPFGSIYTKAFGYEEALYMGMGGYFHLEGSSNDDVPALDKNTSKNVGTTNMNAVQKGFKIKGTNSVITWDKIIYATADTGDFNAELLNNGTVVLFATGGMPDNGSKENIKIYMAVFNPTDNATEIECISVAELPFGYIQSKYDLAPMLQVVTGNIINDKQNKQKISPDEFIVTYPSYNEKTGWYLKHVVYQVVSLTNNNCRISAFAYHSDIVLDYGSKLVDLFIEDVNGDGVQELITRDVEVRTNGEVYLQLSIHTIKDGKLWDMDMGYFSYVCEGGILEVSEDFTDYGNGSAYHYFFRCTEDGVEPIEKIVRDPITLYWGHALAGQDGKTVTEEKAKSILNSYKRLDLNWKPFAEYPLT